MNQKNVFDRVPSNEVRPSINNNLINTNIQTAMMPKTVSYNAFKFVKQQMAGSNFDNTPTGQASHGPVRFIDHS